MNMPFPAFTAHKLPNGSLSVCVNWMHPQSNFADFVLDAVTNGPFEETHRGVYFRDSIMIIKSSEMEN